MLNHQIVIRETAGKFEIELDISGHANVPIALELCFRRGGTLSGVTASGDAPDEYFLEQGTGQYKHGEETIEFGPGQADHRWNRMGGATPKADGMRVYLTGLTPFRKSVFIG